MKTSADSQREILRKEIRKNRKRRQNRELRNVRWNDAEQALMQEKADRYMRGNLSAWVRLAATRHVPTGRLK